MPFCSAIFKVLAPTVLEFWSYGLLNFCFWGILNPNCGLSFAAIVFKLEHKEVLLRTSVGFVAAAVSMSTGGCRAISVDDVSVAVAETVDVIVAAKPAVL